MTLTKAAAQEAEPQDAAAWKQFVARAVARTTKAYNEKPDFLLGHGRGELSATKDYASRELLELVQNAADAATEAGVPGRVHIEVRVDGLIVANTGQPFQAGGVRSLLTANTSPKPSRTLPMIGAKGLGFRALLNWSSQPHISSGDLELSFSRQHAWDQAHALATTNAELAELLAGAEAEVPVLAYPLVGDEARAASEAVSSHMMDRVQQLRDQGYDTVVAACFEGTGALDKAILQADEFRPEFLLFVPALERIELRVIDRHALIWRRKLVDENLYDLEVERHDGVASHRWFCRLSEGEVGTGKAKKRYQVAVAVRPAALTGGTLHSFFPTNVPLPFPALCHATLELDSSRKSLNADSALNTAVLTALAAHYAETTAELLALKQAEPMDLLARTAEFPAPLLSFETQTYARAARLKILPTFRARRVTAEELQVGPMGYETFFPRRHFADLARSRGLADRQVLERLGVKLLSAEDAVASLRQMALSLKERAAVILGVARHFPRPLHDRRLFVDANERPLSSNDLCFADPASRKPPPMPTWARARFVHPELWRLLSEGLVGTPRTRIAQLSGFGVHEFNVDGVITSLRAQAILVLNRKTADPERIRLDLLRAVFGLFAREGRRSLYPAGRLEVRCVDGAWRDARDVHLSQGYGGTGAIMSGLFSGRPDLLVADSIENGFEGAMDEVRAFLEWIGVKPWPKAGPMHPSNRLREVVLQAVPDPFQVSDGTFVDTLTRQEARNSASITYDGIEGLDDILKSAPAEAILAWLAQDSRFNAPFLSRLRAGSGRKLSRPYHGDLPDLVRYLIATTPWLPTRDGGVASPRDAMVSPGRLGELFPSPAPWHEDAAYGLTREMWARGLYVAGVARSLSDLDEGRIFDLLGTLQTKKPPTETVRRVYSQILDLDHFDASRAPAQAKRFFASGQLQARRGGVVEWAPVGDVYYLDRDNVPSAARDLVALIDLPSRKNSTDILARFGAGPLSQRNLVMRVLERTEEAGPIAALLDLRWQTSLPFIRAYRRASNTDNSALRPLDQLQLSICLDAELEVTVDAEQRRASLEPWKHAIAGDDLIVVIDPIANEDEIMLMAAEAIGDGIAERLGLQTGTDFTRLLSAPSDGMRATQLRRLLTHRSPEEIDALLAEITSQAPPGEPENGVDAAFLARALAPEAKPSPAAPAPPPPAPSPTPTNATAPAAIANDPATSPPLAPVVGVTVSPAVPHIPNIGGTGGGGGGGGPRLGGWTGALGAPRDPNRPADAEAWAEFYEAREGRFALSVARIQGDGAFGCDLLSFATEGDRAIFQADPKRTDLVIRFIEVKSGGVRLVANEIKAANRRRGKYYVYRVQFDNEQRDSAVLTIVADPLSHGKALSRECDVRIHEINARVEVKLHAVRAVA